MAALQVVALSKGYKQYPSRWARLADWFFPGKTLRHHWRWVLQDINLDVAPGEALGIIGINGAGKSTLLKLITGTQRPTTGEVILKGRVAAMLELGMGFHPDFTGRQNVYMAGQLQGFSAQEMTDLLPAIEDFAEIGDYLDQPVRVYSSGMQVRLAFSVATAVRPDVLIVDEALSVGDAYFQHKCFSRIRSFQADGTTLLLVSHDKQAILGLCDRALLLQEGRIALVGSPESVMDYYNASLAQRTSGAIRQVAQPDGSLATHSGSGQARLTQVWLADRHGEACDVVAVGQSVVLHVRVRCEVHLDDLVLGFMIKDRLGQSVYGTNTHHLQATRHDLDADQTLVFSIAFPANLGPATYSVAVALHGDDTHVARNYEWRDHALVFTVVNTDKPDFIGSAWLPTDVTISS